MTTDDKKQEKPFWPEREPDRSKWTGKAEPAKLGSLRHTLALAKLIRQDVELWQIYQSLGPEDWVPEEVGVKAMDIYLRYRQGNNLSSEFSIVERGIAVGLVRDLAEGKIPDLDSKEAYEKLKSFSLLKNDLNELG